MIEIITFLMKINKKGAPCFKGVFDTESHTHKKKK